jgi:hypothetical protein
MSIQHVTMSHGNVGISISNVVWCSMFLEVTEVSKNDSSYKIFVHDMQVPLLRMVSYVWNCCRCDDCLEKFGKKLLP